MRIDVSAVLEEVGKSETFTGIIPNPGETLPDMPPGFNEPLAVRATITNGGSSLWVAVHLRTSVELPCSRCLAPVARPLTLDYREQYFAAAQRQEPLVDEGDIRVALYEDKEVDLTEGIRENLLLALPVRSLCESDCQGLCAQCGHNLNEGPCDCDGRPPVDPRLSVLGKLLEGDPDS